MSKNPYLTRSTSGSFYFMRRYPTELRALFDGPFQKLNLETSDRAEAELARRRQAALRQGLDVLCRSFIQVLDGGPASLVMTRLIRKCRTATR